MPHKMLSQLIPLRHAEGVLVEDVKALGLAERSDNRGTEFREVGVIPLCIASATGGPLIEVLEFHPQYRRLQRVEAAVDPDDMMVILRLRTMDAHTRAVSQPSMSSLVASAPHPRTAQVLGGKKLYGPADAHGAGLAPVESRANRLRGIFTWAGPAAAAHPSPRTGQTDGPQDGPRAGR